MLSYAIIDNWRWCFLLVYDMVLESWSEHTTLFYFVGKLSLLILICVLLVRGIAWSTGVRRLGGLSLQIVNHVESKEIK